jgi:hypothetical protein
MVDAHGVFVLERTLLPLKLHASLYGSNKKTEERPFFTILCIAAFDLRFGYSQE